MNDRSEMTSNNNPPTLADVKQFVFDNKLHVLDVNNLYYNFVLKTDDVSLWKEKLLIIGARPKTCKHYTGDKNKCSPNKCVLAPKPKENKKRWHKSDNLEYTPKARH